MSWFWWLIIGILALNVLVILLIALALFASKLRKSRIARQNAEGDVERTKEPDEQPAREHASGQKGS